MSVGVNYSIQPAKAQASCSLLDLPDEILCNVMDHLNSKDLSIVSQVCIRAFHIAFPEEEKRLKAEMEALNPGGRFVQDAKVLNQEGLLGKAWGKIYGYRTEGRATFLKDKVGITINGEEQLVDGKPERFSESPLRAEVIVYGTEDKYKQKMRDAQIKDNPLRYVFNPVADTFIPTTDPCPPREWILEGHEVEARLAQARNAYDAYVQSKLEFDTLVEEYNIRYARLQAISDPNYVAPLIHVERQSLLNKISQIFTQFSTQVSSFLEKLHR